MKLSYVPQIKVIHTSKIFHGQLFVPIANWLLMIGTILIASIYKNVCLLIVSMQSHILLNSYHRLHLLAMHMECASCL